MPLERGHRREKRLPVVSAGICDDEGEMKGLAALSPAEVGDGKVGLSKGTGRERGGRDEARKLEGGRWLLPGKTDQMGPSWLAESYT